MTFSNPVILDAALKKLLLVFKKRICKLPSLFKLFNGLRTTNIFFGLLIIFINCLTDLGNFSKAANIIIRLSFGMKLGNNSTQYLHMSFCEPTLLKHRDE